jgi:hypothetical protein
VFEGVEVTKQSPAETPARRARLGERSEWPNGDTPTEQNFRPYSQIYTPEKSDFHPYRPDFSHPKRHAHRAEGLGFCIKQYRFNRNKKRIPLNTLKERFKLFYDVTDTTDYVRARGYSRKS